MDAGQKLKASSAFLQIKVGLKDHFLQASHALYGHWATNTLIQQIWNETEAHELHLKHAEKIVWTPQLQCWSDLCMMEFATTIYSKKLSNKINKCHLYLQVITSYDIIIYGGKQIHPNMLIGIRPPSCQSTHHYGKNSP